MDDVLKDNETLVFDTATSIDYTHYIHNSCCIAEILSSGEVRMNWKACEEAAADESHSVSAFAKVMLAIRDNTYKEFSSE